MEQAQLFKHLYHMSMECRYGDLVRSRERVHETRSFRRRPPRFGLIAGRELSASRLSEVLPEHFQDRRKGG